MQPEKVYVFDTTLRDGEQAAGTRLGKREKLSIARQLAQLRVDIIEAGYPNSSPEDFQAVEDIACEIRDVTVCALSRAVPEDIHSCGKALAKAKRPRIHTGIGASDIHIMGKFRDDKYGRTLAEKRITILKMAAEAVKLAKSYADDVEFYAEDAGRSEQAYLF
jgi:2-isopropylmalate synthase